MSFSRSCRCRTFRPCDPSFSSSSSSGPRQYLALLNVIVDGKRLSLGCFHSAEEAALMVARKLAQIEREKQAQATLAQRQQQAQ